MVRAALLPHNFPQLQNLIKRDPKSYREEFLQQYQHFKASKAIVLLRPASPDEHFQSLITFISHVSNFFEESKDEFPVLLMDLVKQEASAMEPHLRMSLVKALLLLRKYEQIDLRELFELFFNLLRISDKALRTFLYQSIVNEVRRANKPHKNNALNKMLQNYMYSIFGSSREEITISSNIIDAISINKFLQIIIELYQKRIWDDARTVNVVAEAAINKSFLGTKVVCTALNFFIGRFKGKSLKKFMIKDKDDKDNDSDDDGSENENGTIDKSIYQKMVHKNQINGNGNKRSSEKKLKRALAAVHRRERRLRSEFIDSGKDQNGSFSPINLLNDPQGFVEKLFNILKKSNDSFETKLLMMNVISRVIGTHQLILFDFYSFLLRYIQPHQSNVTHILAYTAQATHRLVPEDVLSPILKAITNAFVSDHCANEVIAVGLNGIREICARCPMAMEEDLLHDLATFKGYHDKGVVIAARSLIGLYRDVAPGLLSKKDRGKDAAIAVRRGTFPKPIPYGEGIKDPTLHLDVSVGSFGPATDEQVKEESEEEVEDEEFETFSDSSDNLDYSDEEIEEKVQDNKKSKIEPISKRTKSKDIFAIASTRLLTPQEMSLFRCHVQHRDIMEEMEKKGSDKDGDSVYSEESSDEVDECGNDLKIVNPDNLKSAKKIKADYEARMASIKSGREGRLKYGSRRGKHNTHSSLTNRIKEKRNKNTIMLVHKQEIRDKLRRNLNGKNKRIPINKKGKRRK